MNIRFPIEPQQPCTLVRSGLNESDDCLRIVTVTVVGANLVQRFRSAYDGRDAICRGDERRGKRRVNALLLRFLADYQLRTN